MPFLNYRMCAKTPCIFFDKILLCILGLLMAKALYNRQLVEMPLCKYIFRHILGVPKEFQDLKEVNLLIVMTSTVRVA
jgi:hypothetical protein